MNTWLVYKASGGLAHMLFQIEKGIEMSRISGRTLILDCNKITFNEDFNKYFTIPNFEYLTHTSPDIPECIDLESEAFFRPPKDYVIGLDRSSAINESKVISYDNSDLSFLKSSEASVYYSYIYGINIESMSIRIKDDIAEYLDSQRISGPYIGVHYRNTDMKHPISPIINKVRSLKDKCKTVYLATDDIDAIATFKNELPEFDIILKTTPYKRDVNELEMGIHYANPDKNQVIKNALIDLYNLRNSSYFIPSNKSAFSRLVPLLK